MACVVVNSETGAEYIESRGCGVVVGPAGCGHPTAPQLFRRYHPVQVVNCCPAEQEPFDLLALSCAAPRAASTAVPPSRQIGIQIARLQTAESAKCERFSSHLHS